MKRIVILLAVLALGSAVSAAGFSLPGDEFVGPFPSWSNAKTDYGAVGDGKADDTAALQKALDDLRQPTFPKRVLYLPAGTYRLTATLQLLRATHNESQGICIFGEDPEKTILKWDGPQDGVMLHYNPWYAALGRLTLDGQGKAKTALQHGRAFTTANEISDLIVKDVDYGIEAGLEFGIAETAVLRCRFYRCRRIAISIQDFNSLDWYIWHNWFEECGIGVSNERGAGNFHVYESAFVRSRQADVTTKHCGYFTLYGNVSLGSRSFMLAKRANNWADSETWGSNFTMQKNVVLDTREATPVVLENHGPFMLLDNTFRTPAGPRPCPVVLLSCPTDGADLIALGNTFTAANPLSVKGRLREADNRVVARSSLSTLRPVPYPFLPRVERPVLEVKAGADAAGIQAAVDEAAKLNGKRPVVHLPAATYGVNQTIVLPAGTDLQLVGDAMLQGTQLNWAGPGEGPILEIRGPSRATLRHLGFSGGKTARAIVGTGLDQPGARVFMEQGQTMGNWYGLVVEGLDRAYVALHDHGHNSMQVLGGAQAAAGKRPEGITALFCGASSRHLHDQDQGVDLYNVDQGGRLLVRDIWYEGQIWHFMNFTGHGEFTYHSGNIAPYSPPNPNDAVIAFDGFRGKVTLSQIEPMNGALRVSKAQGLDLLMLGLFKRDVALRLPSPAEGRVAFLSGREFRANGTGSDPLPEVGEWDPAFVREMLAAVRTELPRELTPVPPGATDLRLYRVMAYGKEGVRLQGP